MSQTRGLLFFLLIWSLAGCSNERSGSPLQAPANLVATPELAQVKLEWSPVPAATGYSVFWRIEDAAGGSFQEIRLTGTKFVHEGLIDNQDYRYAIVAWNEAAQSPLSVPVTAQPGPVPEPISWVTVTSSDVENTVHWPATPDANSFVVSWSDSRSAIINGAAEVDKVIVDAPPWRHQTVNPDQPYYYRVHGINGPRGGPQSMVAKSTALAVQSVNISAAFTPALLDINGDGCLDAIAAFGDCSGGFLSMLPANLGLEDLLAPGRENRDTRIADFNGDGLADLFTNVYSPADDPDSYAILHFNNGDHTFSEDPRLRALEIGGFGETVLVADFNNDGAVDIFIPHYTSQNDGGQYWLLINDGAGGFSDAAMTAGIDNAAYFNPEAAQALDFDQDGWIDIFVGSQLFRNNGDLTFTDVGDSIGLPILFDEGAKFSDVDLDGDLDFIHHDQSVTRLFRNIDGTLDDGTVIDAPSDSFGYGLNLCDLNADGYQDIVVASNSSITTQGQARLILNVGGEFLGSRLWAESEAYNDLLACADINNDGALDVLGRRSDGYLAYLSQKIEKRAITLRVIGSEGQLNQQGRVIRVVPSAAQDKQLLRFVEAGSGYMAQGGYDVVLGAPWDGPYDVAIRFADGWINTTVHPGDSVTISENGDVSCLSRHANFCRGQCIQIEPNRRDRPSALGCGSL